MKVLLSTVQGGLDDQVSPIFGRAPTFTLVELGSDGAGKVSISRNSAMSSPGGAGLAAAQIAIDLGAEAVVSGDFGPKAVYALMQAGIRMHRFSGSVRQALERLSEGELPQLPSDAAPGAGPMGRGMGRMGYGRGRGGMP